MPQPTTWFEYIPIVCFSIGILLAGAGLLTFSIAAVITTLADTYSRFHP